MTITDQGIYALYLAKDTKTDNLAYELFGYIEEFINEKLGPVELRYKIKQLVEKAKKCQE